MSDTNIAQIRAQVEQAINVIYDGKYNNEERLEATKFLEEVKNKESSLTLGPILYDESGVETIQYYGLQLVDFNISNKYTNVMSLQMKHNIKNWLIQACFKVTDKTPKFIKEKLTYLWVAIAKREYGECCKYNINGELLEVNQSSKSDSTSEQNDNQDNYQYSTKTGSKIDDPNNLRNDPLDH